MNHFYSFSWLDLFRIAIVANCRQKSLIQKTNSQRKLVKISKLALSLASQNRCDIKFNGLLFRAHMCLPKVAVRLCILFSFVDCFITLLREQIILRHKLNRSDCCKGWVYYTVKYPHACPLTNVNTFRIYDGNWQVFQFELCNFSSRNLSNLVSSSLVSCIEKRCCTTEWELTEYTGLRRKVIAFYNDCAAFRLRN